MQKGVKRQRSIFLLISLNCFVILHIEINQQNEKNNDEDEGEENEGDEDGENAGNEDGEVERNEIGEGEENEEYQDDNTGGTVLKKKRKLIFNFIFRSSRCKI